MIKVYGRPFASLTSPLKRLKGLVQMFPTFDFTLDKNQWNSNLCYVSTEKACIIVLCYIIIRKIKSNAVRRFL